jgi:hypothetical protein
MADAPARIWAWREKPNDSGAWDEAGCRDRFPDDVEYVRADLAPAPDALRQAREALAPFADQAERFPADGSLASAAWTDEEECDLTLTVGDLRRARAALAALEGK